MDINQAVSKKAYSNYNCSTPWPLNDKWHEQTFQVLHKKVSAWLNENFSEYHTVLCVGCGTTVYKTNATILYMDIIEEYAKSFSNYIIGSAEKIPLADNSVDGIICVGSVLNYVDAQKSILEFQRVLRCNGKIILEFERSNSAEFLLTPNYAKEQFLKEYDYNSQSHLLWMYNEKHILDMMTQYNLLPKSIFRFHILSSLLFRFGFSENKVSHFSKYDEKLQLWSFPFAHNTIVESYLLSELEKRYQT